jgi:hypothetical protein
MTKDKRASFVANEEGTAPAFYGETQNAPILSGEVHPTLPPQGNTMEVTHLELHGRYLGVNEAHEVLQIQLGNGAMIDAVRTRTAVNPDHTGGFHVLTVAGMDVISVNVVRDPETGVLTSEVAIPTFAGGGAPTGEWVPYNGAVKDTDLGNWELQARDLAASRDINVAGLGNFGNVLLNYTEISDKGVAVRDIGGTIVTYMDTAGFTGAKATVTVDAVTKAVLSPNQLRLETASAVVNIGTGATAILVESGGQTAFRVSNTGLVSVGRSAVDPSAPEAGSVYFNTASGKLKLWNGTAWRTVTDS